MNKKIVSGIISDTTIFAITILINLVLVPMYLYYMSLELYGVYIAVQSFISLISIFDFSMIVHNINKFSGGNFFESSDKKDFINFSEAYHLILAFFLFFIGAIIMNFMPDILSIAEENIAKSQEMFYYSWMGFLITIIFGLNQAILISQHELTLVNISIFIIFIFTHLFNFIFLSFGYDFSYFGISIFIANLVVYLSLYVVVLKKYNINIFHINSIPLKYFKESIIYTLKLKIINTSQMSKTSIFPVILSNLGGQTYLAQYNITNRLPSLIPSFISKLIMNLFPILSKFFLENNLYEIEKIFEKIFKIAFLSIFFLVYLIYIINPIFIDIWVGNDKFIGNSIFVFILINLFILSIIAFSGIFIQSSGNFQRSHYVFLLEFVIFIVLSIALYKILGIVGFFLGYTISSLVGVVYTLNLIRKMVNINFNILIRGGIKYVLIMLFLFTTLDNLMAIFIDNRYVLIMLKSSIFLLIFLYYLLKYLKLDYVELIKFIKTRMD